VTRIYRPPRQPCASRARAMCRAKVAARDDVPAVWWLTVAYTDDDSSELRDELHVELEPPGRHGASPEFVRDFRWTSLQVGHAPTWTFTSRPRLPAVKAVAKLVAQRVP
jgi:hypothetical protein